LFKDTIAHADSQGLHDHSDCTSLSFFASRYYGKTGVMEIAFFRLFNILHVFRFLEERRNYIFSNKTRLHHEIDNLVITVKGSVPVGTARRAHGAEQLLAGIYQAAGGSEAKMDMKIAELMGREKESENMAKALSPHPRGPQK